MTAEPIAFWKLTAAGNDFVCFDNHDGRFDDLISDPRAYGHFARTICRRGHGIGADGVIFACETGNGDIADIAATVLESDGSECELCGNATACLTMFAILSESVPDGLIRISTPAGVIKGRRTDGDYIRVCIPSPENHKIDMQLDADGVSLCCDFVVAGIPHVVTYVDDLEAVDVARLGYALRHHEAFQPRGANANFVQVLGEGDIAIRTFEFGVEGETLACGTGSSASAILAALRYGWDDGIRSGKRPVLVRTRSGKVVRVYFHISEGDMVTDVCLETMVHQVMRGRLNEEYAASAMTPDDAEP